jgi:riboflavin synthase
VFTGLIADVGSVRGLQRSDAGATLEIGTRLADELSEGDSVAVNGVCLTATDVRDETFRAQAIPETLQRSSLGRLDVGSRVNIELPLRLDGRLGGHVVQGHVDATGVVGEVRKEGFSRILEVRTDPQLERYLVEKGSVAIDGVSLTVSGLREDAFEVCLIPETLKRTTLGGLGPGALVNIELDVIAKHVERLMRVDSRAVIEGAGS